MCFSEETYNGEDIMFIEWECPTEASMENRVRFSFHDCFVSEWTPIVDFTQWYIPEALRSVYTLSSFENLTCDQAQSRLYQLVYEAANIDEGVTCKYQSQGVTTTQTYGFDEIKPLNKAAFDEGNEGEHYCGDQGGEQGPEDGMSGPGQWIIKMNYEESNGAVSYECA